VATYDLASPLPQNVVDGINSTLGTATVAAVNAVLAPLLTDTQLRAAPVPVSVPQIIVGGNNAEVSVSFGPSTLKSYAAGQIIGTLQEVTNCARLDNGSGIMTSVGIALAAGFNGQIDVLVFSVKPTASFADGTSLVLNFSDAQNLSKIWHVTDWTTLAPLVCYGQAPAETAFYQCEDAMNKTSLWALCLAQSALALNTPQDLQLTLRMKRD